MPGWRRSGGALRRDRLNCGSDDLTDAVGHEHRARIADHDSQDRTSLAGTAQDCTDCPGQHERDQYRQKGNGNTEPTGGSRIAISGTTAPRANATADDIAACQGWSIVRVDTEFHVDVGGEASRSG